MPKKKKENIDWGNLRVCVAVLAAHDLFWATAKEHGEITAREIFIRTTKFTKAEENQWRDYLILHRYDRIPENNIAALARQLSAEGLGTVATVDHRIRELVKKRKKAIAERTWPPSAPPWPWKHD